MSQVKPLTQKGINSIANTGYLNVWEGAVRSGKTVASSIAWIMYTSNSPENFFIMSGKTIATLYRNVLGGEFGMIAMLGKNGQYKIDREGNRILSIKGADGSIKKCYCFGAHDDSSYQVMRGLTAGGWYADEINLHPQSFIEEAFRRTIVSQDRKNFWTLNPDNPNHWIYREYIDYYENIRLKGFYLWHFNLEDNLAMPPERKEELKAQFKGIFYRRYILGERVLAEGVIYSMLDEGNFYDDNDRPYQLHLKAIRSISADYGTTNPSHWLDIYDDGDTIWVDNEYRWDSKGEEAQATGIGQKIDTDYVADMHTFMRSGDGPECEVIVDPAAAHFIAALKREMFYVTQADNDVDNGIKAVSNLLGTNKLRIHKERCKHLIQELTGYSWDEKATMRGEEKPVKINDHGADALRYYVKTKLPDWRTGLSDGYSKQVTFNPY